jgi:imidazolonepropionase-like amidohydrolase
MGRRVTAHAHGGGRDQQPSCAPAATRSSTAPYLDAESIRLLRREGTSGWCRRCWPGTSSGGIASGPDNFFTPAQTAKALEAGPLMLDMVASRPRRAEVRIAFGTDSRRLGARRQRPRVRAAGAGGD